MFKTANLGRNLLIALVLSVFVLPVANAGLVEIYINDSEELTESEEEFVIKSGKDLDLEIRLKGDYRIESDNENLSVERNKVLIFMIMAINSNKVHWHNFKFFNLIKRKKIIFLSFI